MQSGAAAAFACRTWQSLVSQPVLLCRCCGYVMGCIPAMQWHGTLMMKIFWCFLSHALQSTLWVSNSILGSSPALLTLQLGS